jgi:hypothetical protein
MDTAQCDEPYCVRHDSDGDCVWSDHAVWCTGECGKGDHYSQCTVSLRDGDPDRGSGWHAFTATCEPDAATYVTGELDVYTVEQLDAVFVSLTALRALLVREEAFRTLRAAGNSFEASRRAV